jgi:putative GTP pyrophosphokinase
MVMIIIERNISTKEKQNVIDLRRLLGKNYDELPEMQTIYNRAMENIIEKLESIDHNFYKLYYLNSIHHIESRLKTPESIFNKLKRKGYEPSIKKAKEVLTDIAGIRVICHFKDDIYTVADMLCSQKDITLMCTRDYIKNPKPNGYRSLHIIVSTPVVIKDKIHITPVEIQIRSIAMDFWASLEHQIRYKNADCPAESLFERLKSCADRIAQIDEEMQSINKEIELFGISKKSESL